ncbi:DUF3575 domain-containing protein [Reinekea sp. G2M2-21]|uniref:DUF3575 domain-containing protein n=1 Tax=Reinekea sp. G2M2-21 TaxID=2788942 RepID=UPI0018AAC6BB|nr:DUF3575 domain-containing protein [Reinekea sp. G2M2-21]
MKKVIFATAIAALGTCAVAKDMAIEANPLGLAIGLFNGSFLYDINDTLSVGPTVSYWNFDLGSSDEYTYLNLGGRLEYMPDTNKVSGLYVSGSANRASFSVTSRDGSLTCEGNISTIGLTATGGYKFISAGGFIAKVGAGYGLGSVGALEGRCSDDSVYNETADLPFGGLAFEWTLGYKF